MKITLRQKPLKDGNASLYLDYYDKGKREYEFLDLYLVPDNAPCRRQRQSRRSGRLTLKGDIQEWTRTQTGTRKTRLPG